jgi:hypothetical protein
MKEGRDFVTWLLVRRSGLYLGTMSVLNFRHWTIRLAGVSNLRRYDGELR